MVCIDGYETQLLINFVYVNNSVEVVTTPQTLPCTKDYAPIISLVFLILIFIAAFILSTLVIVTIYVSYSQKEKLLSNLIVNLCITVILDCLFNLIISISYVGTGPWKFGYDVCNLSGFMTNVAATQMSWCILLLALDRVMVAMKIGRYMRISERTIRITIVLTWVASIAISIPLSWGLLASAPFRYRYACNVTDRYEEYHAGIQLAIVVILVPLVGLISSAQTFRIFFREQKKHKRVKGNQTYNLFDQILMTPYYRDEVYSSLCIGIIVILYCCCWVPYVGVMSLDSLFNDHWIDLLRNITAALNEEPDFPTTRLASIDRMNGVNISRRDILRRVASTSNVNVSIPEEHLIEEVVLQNTHELAFTWLRYIMDLLVPIVFLVIMKNMRDKCTALLFFCRPNSVDTGAVKMVPPRYMASGLNHKTNLPKEKDKNVLSFKTPVLFATSEGLHLRTVEESYLNQVTTKPVVSFNKGAEQEPQFSYDLCDVIPWSDDVTDIEDQNVATHYDGDYDEVDFDDEGNPIIRNAQKAAVSHKKVFLNEQGNMNVFHGRAPPTPPKRKTSGQSENEILFDSTIEMPIEKKKSGKNVHFNTGLNEEIVRPRTADSIQMTSSGNSGVSSDSGNMGDIEEPQAVFAPKTKFKSLKKPVKKKPSFSKAPREKVAKNRKTGPRPKVSKKVKRIAAKVKSF